MRCRKLPLKQHAVYQIPSTFLVRRSGPTSETPTSPQTENKQLRVGQDTNYVFHRFDIHYVGMERNRRTSAQFGNDDLYVGGDDTGLQESGTLG